MYAFGVLVYELMHGRTPHWDANNLGALVRRVVTAPVIVLGSVIGFPVVCVIGCRTTHLDFWLFLVSHTASYAPDRF